LLQLGIESVSSEIVLSRAVDISMALGHPIKDCLYLALAERWQTVLVTADLKLVGKANASVWANFVTSLSNVEEIIRNP
jgi:predicted nucleic acid-binding protein